MVLPIATSLRSRLELMMQEMLVAKSAHKIHTRNSTETGRKADGRATVAPHEQMQFISVSFPHFNVLPPLCRLLLGNPASLLHHCSTVLLLPPAPSFAPGLRRATLTCAPSSPQAEILPLHHLLEAGGSHTRKMRMRRTLCLGQSMARSALPGAFCVLTLVRGVLAPNSSILLLFMWLLFCVSHWHPGQVIENRIWLRTRDNLLPT